MPISNYLGLSTKPKKSKNKLTKIALLIIIAGIATFIGFAPGPKNSGWSASEYNPTSGIPTFYARIKTDGKLSQIGFNSAGLGEGTLKVCVQAYCQTYEKVTQLDRELLILPTTVQTPRPHVYASWTQNEKTYELVDEKVGKWGYIESSFPNLPEEAWAFVRTQRLWSKEGLAWDKCQKPIPVKFNFGDLSPAMIRKEKELFYQVFDYIYQTTGVRFVDVGTTTFTPSTSNAITKNQDWAVTIAYTDFVGEEKNPNLQRLAVGGWRVGGIHADGKWYLEQGYVLIHKGRMSVWPDKRKAVYLHEMGHVMGLGHSAIPTQIMYPIIQKKVPVWGKYDQQGLDLLYQTQQCS